MARKREGKYYLVYQVYKNPRRKRDGVGESLSEGFTAKNDEDARKKVPEMGKGRLPRRIVELLKVVKL
jgi:hypothetical protein